MIFRVKRLYDKDVVTTGGSGFGNTMSELKPSAPDAKILEGKVFHKASKTEIAEWVKSIS